MDADIWLEYDVLWPTFLTMLCFTPENRTGRRSLTYPRPGQGRTNKEYTFAPLAKQDV